MKATGVHAGDILRLDVRGQTFYARATTEVFADFKLGKRGIKLEPLTPGQHLPAYFITARQIIGHWRRARGSQP